MQEANENKDSCSARLGQKIKDFRFSTYNPETDSFEEHSFSEYSLLRKWIILFFYPADFTFVCPTELADISKYCKMLKDMDVEIVSMFDKPKEEVDSLTEKINRIYFGT